MARLPRNRKVREHHEAFEGLGRRRKEVPASPGAFTAIITAS